MFAIKKQTLISGPTYNNAFVSLVTNSRGSLRVKLPRPHSPAIVSATFNPGSEQSVETWRHTFNQRIKLN